MMTSIPMSSKGNTTHNRGCEQATGVGDIHFNRSGEGIQTTQQILV